MNNWIEDWFGSEYYEQLYSHRNKDEAFFFLNKLIPFLKLSASSRILDCCCGKGRHSLILASMGFDVTGIDLCKSNILELKKHESENLRFFIHDARNIFRVDYYDVALCLFTSFGYYEADAENNKVLRTLSYALKKGGKLVLDYMNAIREIKNIVPCSEFSYNNVQFLIKRNYSGNRIYKEIEVNDNGKKYFRESVRVYSKQELENLLSANHLNTIHLFGDYELNQYDEKKSERIIIIAEKA